MKKERNVFFTGKEENGVPIFRCDNEKLLLVNYSVETVAVELTEGEEHSTKEVIHVLYELLNSEGFEKALAEYLFSTNHKSCEKAVVKKVKIKRDIATIWYEKDIDTDRIIEELNKSQTPIVFLLWGNFAKQKARLITNKKHLILTSSHPSPFSVKYGFEGCSHFSKANKFLASNNLTPIDWQIDDI